MTFSQVNVAVPPTLKDYAIAPIPYDDADSFSEGLARVAINRQYAFIDHNGKVVFQTKLSVGNFSEGYAIASDGHRYGYIDRRGRVAIPLKYAEVAPFSEGLAAVSILIAEHSGSIVVGDTGYIDEGNQFIIQPQYKAARSFHQGLAAAFSKGAWGFIDKSGDFSIPAQFDDVRDFSEGVARVQKDGKIFFIDANGAVQLRINAPFVSCGSGFSEGLLECMLATEKWGYVNRAGDIVIQAIYDEAEPFSEGLAAVTTGKKMGFINRKGILLIKSQFDRVLSPFHSGYCIVQENQKVGILGQDGRYLIAPCLEFAGAFSEGLAAVHVNGKCGYISQRKAS
jgi:hypothetical protein